MRVLSCLLGLAIGATSQALTFQFLFRSSRSAEVDTRFDVAKQAPNGDVVVAGRAGSDLVIPRWDRFGNLLMSTTYDGPDKETEAPVDIDVDNLNAVWVIYDTGAGATRMVRFDLNLNLVFDIPAGIPGELAKRIVVNAAREGLYCGVGVDARDTFAAKVSGAGAQRWRRLVGRIQFRDADLRPGGDGLIMVGRNTTTQQGVITAFANLDGARPFTFQTTDPANSLNAISQIATNRTSGNAYAVGYSHSTTQPTHMAYKITSASTVSSAPIVFPIDLNVTGLATSQTTPDITAVVGAAETGGGGLTRFNESLQDPGFTSVFASPTPSSVVVSRLGTAIYVSGASTQDPTTFQLRASLLSFDPTSLQFGLNYQPGFGSQEATSSLTPTDDNEATAVGRDPFQGRTKGVMVRASHPTMEWRVTNIVEQNPTRTVVDSAADSSGAVYLLAKLGTIERPNLVVKRSSTGAELWQARLPDEGFVGISPRAIAVGPNGLPVVAGILPNGELGTWIVLQLNPANGEVIWKKTIGFPSGGSGEIRDLAVSAANEILVGGSTVQGFGTQDMAAARLTGAGVLRWTRVVGGSFTDSTHRVAFHPSGAAVTYGFIDEKYPRLITYSATGATLSTVSTGGGSVHYGDGMDLEPNGTVVYAHSFENGGAILALFRVNPLDGTIFGGYSEPGSSAPTVVGTSDGQPWLIRKQLAGTFLASRVNGSSTFANAPLPDNTTQVAGAFRHTDESVVFTGVTVNPTTLAVASFAARHLPTGPRAALRNFAGTVKSLSRASDGSAWPVGDQKVQQQGTELFMAKYTVP